MICSVVKYKPTSPPQGTHIGIKNRTRQWVREWERERKREREKKNKDEWKRFKKNISERFNPATPSLAVKTKGLVGNGPFPQPSSPRMFLKSNFCILGMYMSYAYNSF